MSDGLGLPNDGEGEQVPEPDEPRSIEERTIKPGGGQPISEQISTAGDKTAKAGKGCMVGCISIVIVGALLFLLVSCISGGGSSGDPAKDDNSTMAWVMCQGQMDKNLKAPGTAGYPLSNEFMIHKAGATYTMNAWVDAQNGFGAQIRTKFSCAAVDKGDSMWDISVTPE